MEVLELAEVFKEIELLMERLYKHCQKLFPEFANEFRQLELEETGHACLLDQVIASIKRAPGSWKMGTMSVASARLLKDRLSAEFEEIVSGKTSSKYAITYALSLELSLSEKDYRRALIGDDESLIHAMDKLAEGFDSHYGKLKELEKKLLRTGQTGFDDLNRV